MGSENILIRCWGLYTIFLLGIFVSNSGTEDALLFHGRNVENIFCRYYAYIHRLYELSKFIWTYWRIYNASATFCIEICRKIPRSKQWFSFIHLFILLIKLLNILQDFIISKIKNLKNLDNWFEPISIPQKQVEITTLITDLAINYHNNSTEDFPFLSLPKKRKHCTKSIDSSSVSRQVEKSSVVEKNLSTGLRNFDLRNRTEKFIEFFKSPLKKKNSRV